MKVLLDHYSKFSSTFKTHLLLLQSQPRTDAILCINKWIPMFVAQQKSWCIFSAVSPSGDSPDSRVAVSRTYIAIHFCLLKCPLLTPGILCVLLLKQHYVMMYRAIQKYCFFYKIKKLSFLCGKMISR